MSLTNTIDPNWVSKFVTEVLTDTDYEEFSRVYDMEKILQLISKKLVHVSIGNSHAFLNHANMIEEDYAFEKIASIIYSNTVFQDRFMCAFRRWLSIGC